MDAADRITTRAGLLLVSALLMAAPIGAQTLQVPLNVNLAGTGGQQVSVTSSAPATSEITYTIGAPQYASDNNGQAFAPWLGVSGGTVTPAQLTFSLVSSSGLNQGTHTATVTL